MKIAAKDWIKNKRRQGWNWEEIISFGGKNDQELAETLKDLHTIHDWEFLTISEWKNLVEEQKREWEEDEKLRDERGHTIIVNKWESNGINSVPVGEDSAWQTYKNRLKDKKISSSSINHIEEETFDVLKCLSTNTIDKDPIKGIVIGNVQSGKTASMGALIAMAADYGWNMFIILSGMHKGLRAQTAKRLSQDLDNDNKFFWIDLGNPKLSSEGSKQIDRLDLQRDGKHRYIVTLLKNKDWFKSFIPWIERHPEKAKNLRMLVIDDESDQASINSNASSQNSRTSINEKIINLLEGKSLDGGEQRCQFGAVNYIGYTATPYANLLNETESGSLYPRNFMTTLSVSDEYFGPQQIFGDEVNFSGLDIIRTIPQEPDNDEVQHIADIQSGSADILMLPQALENSVCWFINSVASLRFMKKHNGPVSMLIHTSMKQEAHSKIADLVKWWFEKTSKEDILKKCQEIWEEETNRFTQEDFRRQYPTYGSGQLQIMAYPSFENLRSHIESLLGYGLTTIETDSEDETNHIYNRGIHLCVDNSNDSNEASRLIYPDDEETLNLTPAFIVIGGNTLSRGLTIEGLVSSYFLRPSNCGDTLMQMGRWFGYRRGYELLPRIWMTEATKDNFKYLSDADLDLREQIKDMARSGANFEEVAPSILNSPAASRFKLVAKNKRAAAVETDFDFSGVLYETLIFENDKDKLNKNLDATKNFVCGLGTPDGTPHVHDYHYVWRDIELEKIINYIGNYELSSLDKKFKKMDTMISWLREVTREGKLGKWNIVLAGNRDGDLKWELAKDVSIYLRSRGNSIDSNDRISFKSLRSPRDVFSDIAPEGEFKTDKKTPSNADIFKVRSAYGLEKTPLMIINIMNKNYSVQGDNVYPYKAEQHLAGFTIYIPGHREGRLARRVTVELPGMGYDIED